MALTDRSKRRWARMGFVLLLAACLIPILLHGLRRDSGPAIQLRDRAGNSRTLSLEAMKGLSVLTREGTYQNQYGNWRDHGTYTGVILADLLASMRYDRVEVVASDGYRLTIDKARIVDSRHPMVLAFRFDGQEVPAWEDGFRIAVLPEDGNISNEEYEAESAGSYWVKRVKQLILYVDEDA